MHVLHVQRDMLEQRQDLQAMLVVIVVRLGTMVQVPYQQNLVAVS